MFGQILVMRLFRDHGILTQICGNDFMVLKVAPPLVVTEAQVDEFVSAIRSVVELAHSSSSFWSEALGLARQSGKHLATDQRTLNCSRSAPGKPGAGQHNHANPKRGKRLPQVLLLSRCTVSRPRGILGDKLENPALMRRLQRHTGVEGRYLSLPLHAYAKLATWGETNDLWIQTAVELGKQAVCRALNHAGLAPRDLGAIFFTSVTGISSPSIDALLINRMGLSPNIRRIPMFGLGCVAGAAGISRAADYVKAHPSQLAVLLSVELCSLTLQREDLSVANLISAGLFGDGAAAVIVAGEKCDLPGPQVASGRLELAGPEILGTRSVFYPETENMMGWAISEKGFRIVLSPEVPNLVRERLGGDVNAF